MPIGAVLGGLIRGGTALARAGVIRGTAGKILGGGAKQLPRVLPGAGAIGTGIAGSSIGKILRSGAGVVAAGAGFELGSKLISGRSRKKYRRMNPTNFRALSRALKRVERFEKVVKKAFIVRDFKPRKRSSCR